MEDDADARANLADILAMDGHRVLCAGSAAEAREFADRDVDLVVLDHRLPDAGADGLLPELRKLLPSAEVIMVTGYAEMNATIAAFRDGAADYILKPINPDALRQSVARIMDRRHTQAQLRREHRFSDEILRTAEAIILVLDMEGKIVRFNPYFERITGWSSRDLKGRIWFESCIPPEQQHEIRKVFYETAFDHDTTGVINPVVTANGELRQIRWSNTTLKDEQGETYAVLAVGSDITDLLDAQTRSVQLERLAAIGQTMTALAHESRNALQRLMASLEILSLDLAGQPDAQNDLLAMKKATEDLRDLLEEVRSFAAPIQLHPESIDLSEIWRRVWRHLEMDREDRDVVLIESVTCPSEASVDVLRMEQVFRNLFDNALAACADPVQIRVDCRQAGDHLEVVIDDNGPGLTPEQRQRLFDPFFTTKSTGTGLGLAIVDRIIDAHQGSITVSDSDTGGARFRMLIPRTGCLSK